MTLLDRILARGVELPMDPIVAARLERHLRRIQPDPLFRRRLRGQVLNRYVAAREGLAPAPERRAVRREMGKLGRGVLFASLLTAMSVTAVGAASQNSLPGDALYGIKLELEAIRMQVAPPGLRDDLAILALDQRLREVELLAEAGRWALVDEAAARAVEAEDALAKILGSEGAAEAASRSEEAQQRHADRLAELMATAPATARDGLERALEASTADGPPAAVPERPNPGGSQGGNSGSTNSGGTNSGGTNSGGTNSGGSNPDGSDADGTDSGGDQDDDGDDDDTQGGVQGENPDVESPQQPSQPPKHAPSTH